MSEIDAHEQFRYVVDNRRLIFGNEPSIDQVLAFIAGFNMALGYSLLRGFDEWLVVQLGGGYNIHWFGLVRSLALGIGPWEQVPPDLPRETEERAAQQILDAVVEFLRTMDDPSTRRGIFSAYERLLVADGLLPDSRSE